MFDTHRKTRVVALSFACALPAVVAAHGSQESTATVGLYRFPDISRTEIVFIYANDIWVVPKQGGTASLVANPLGFEGRPRFSPDGKSIAFRANYDKGSDLYTLPTGGGIPRRITHHPGNEGLSDWTPDGRSLIFAASHTGLPSAAKLYVVPAEGGLPTQLPVPYGSNGSLDKTGEWLAYTPIANDDRTWKRYRGGEASDIWLFNLKTGESKQMTDWEGTDTLPMWNGRTVYFLSDRGAAEGNVLNIWRHDVDSGRTEQVTRFKTYDVKWPAIGPDDGGPGEMVLQHGDQIHVVDLATGASRAVSITVPGDRRSLRLATVEARPVSDGVLSPTGKRALVVARGDIWSVPAEQGTPRNLTRTDGVFERKPAWSPDGKMIAFFSDATGEYELYTMPADGRTDGALAQPKQITKPVDGVPSLLRTEIAWSPDSKSVVIQDMAGHLDLVKLEDGSLIRLDKHPAAPATTSISFSHDSRWITWSRPSDSTELSAVYLYDTKESDPAKARTQVTSGFYSDSDPTFDRKGDWLVYSSARHFSPTYSEFDTTWIYDKSEVLMALPLRKDLRLPWLATSDEEVVADAATPTQGADQPKGEAQPEAGALDATKTDATKTEPAKTDPAKAAATIEIETKGFEARSVQLPVAPGTLSFLKFNDRNELLFVREGVVRILALSERAPSEKTGPAGTIVGISADGKKLLSLDAQSQKFAIADASAGAAPKPLVTEPMLVEIQPRHEWRQMLVDAWRAYRDSFYDEGMHGVDWPAIRAKYEALLPAVVTREDLNYLISEMMSELNVGHAFLLAAGDVERAPRRSVGMLGVEFAKATLDDGTPAKAWKLAKFVSGAPFESTARSPLAAHGLGVEEGDYLLAVNGDPVDPTRDPWSQFLDLAEKPVVLTVSKRPVMDKDAKDIVVTTLASESELHERAWVESMRRRVEELSGGKIGYLYVPDTGTGGQNELVRQFYGQRTKPALLIDERWNGGGQVPHRFIELLDRPVTNYWAMRHARDMTWPPDGHRGPKAMLINGPSGSGGDMFPWLFRRHKLGPLIGTRTWGGLVGISGGAVFIDGGMVSVPDFAFYETDGTWGIEGHGVDPDIEVIDDPAKMDNGRDPQLEKAVEVLLKELETNTFQPVPKPKGPNRSGMGLPESDK